jgi:hypothetical protein
VQISPRIAVPLLALVGLAVLLNVVGSHAQPTVARSEVAGARYRLDAGDAHRSGARLLPEAVRRATFHFEPTVAPVDRQAFLAAVAAARPDARRVIGLVDGLVDVRVGPTGVPGAIGLTEDQEPGYGACANREERFAETFAKWAIGDIGVNLDIGYKVPPPSVALDVWGQPLARLAAA